MGDLLSRIPGGRCDYWRMTLTYIILWKLTIIELASFCPKVYRIGEIEKISAGGLCGYKAKYEDKRTVNEEYIFDIPNSRMFNLLDIYIMIKKSSITYDESYKNRIVAEILDGIESN